MDIQSMFNAQKNFNNTFKISPELNLYKLSARKHLEFEIKLGQLADETKCFNYLLNKKNIIDIDSVFNKYITCISMALTLGLDNNYTDLISASTYPNDYCLSDQFLNLYIDINDLLASPSFDHYITLIEDLLSLGLTLGFSEDKIEQEFINKSFEKIVL
ncbi:dUTP diphosphatase [Clostridium sp. BJN0001]|uniref:dUTP diphosphatase n=1 Tax=Clostridium sp. BJN0001 TaxID=2930219 RepID=UPI001FD49261|nr:dUTP diphosphatase [Clostridium sp. BJN0001]